MVSSTKRGVNLGSGVIGGKPGVALGDKGSGCGGTVAEQAGIKITIKQRIPLIYLKSMPYLRLLNE
jgi:hypothetical protein